MSGEWRRCLFVKNMIKLDIFQGTKFNAVVKRNEPLVPLTTLGVGGLADYCVELDKIQDVIDILRFAREHELPVFVLGAGSNIVVADNGWRGLVLRYTNRQLIFHDDNDAIVEASAGLNWDDFVVAMIDRGLGGVECLSGVPGLVGAAPVQNIGCYGQEAADTIEAVEAVDCQTGKELKFTKQECDFGYRQSRFKKDERYLVTKVVFSLLRTENGVALYDDVARELSARNIIKPSLNDVRQAVLTIRRRKSMVIDEADLNSRSVGSFFVNPIVTGDVADEVEQTALRASLPRAMPRWPARGGLIKLSAAWLIESAGFQRGYVLGRAGLSANHTLAIINRDGATAAEIIALAGEIHRRVRDVFGITLMPEPVFVGFDRTAVALLNELP